MREEHEKEKFKGVSAKIYQIFCKAEKIMALNSPMMQLVVYITMILVYWLGARIIILSGGVALSTGELVTLISCAMQILTALMMLSAVLVLITIAQSSAERIVEVLDEKIDINNPENPVMQVKNGQIEFNDIDFSYARDEDKLNLKDINLFIPSGSTVGIIGGTGSSKSTLVQLLPYLYDVTSGQIKIGDVDIRDYDISTLRDSVAMVLQKNILFSGTIMENLRWGNENATDAQVIHAATLAQADNFVELFPNQYETHIDQGGVNVS